MNMVICNQSIKSLKQTCYLINGCKNKRIVVKTNHVKNNDESKTYIRRGQRNTRYHDKILSDKKKSYKFSGKNNFIFICFS